MTKIIIIEGTKVNLVIYKEEDIIDFCWKWINDLDVNKWLITGLTPISFEKEKLWLTQKDGDQSIIFFIEAKDGNPIGSCGLHKIDWYSRKAEIGLLIGEKEYWNMGIAAECEGLLLEYAFNRLGLNRVQVNIYSENKASIKAALKNGFKTEGKLRKYFYRNGSYTDSIMLAILKEEWSKNK